MANTPNDPGQDPLFHDDGSSWLTLAFVRELESLNQNMKDLIKVESNLLDAQGIIPPPTSAGGSGPSTPPPAAAPHTTSPRGQEPQLGSHASRPMRYDDTPFNKNPEQQTQAFTGGTWKGGASSPEDNAFYRFWAQQQAQKAQTEDPSAWEYGAQPGGGPSTPNFIQRMTALKQSGAMAVAMGASEGMNLPRYGEFNTQDIVNLASDATAKVASLLASANTDAEENYTGGPATTMALNAMGTATNVFNKVSNAIPYVRAFTQMTGIPTNPSDINALGTQMGYAQGGTNVGPFRIPGIGIGLGGVGVSPAFSQGVQNSWQSFLYGLEPGGSSKLMEEMQSNLQGYGYSGNNMRDIAAQWGYVQKNQQYGDIGTPQELAPVIDQMLRYGGASIDNFAEALKKIPDAAQAANQSVSQTITGLNQFAQTSQEMGSSYYQGFNTGAILQTATGMTPQSFGAVVNNPISAAFTSALTGGAIPPMVAGLAPAATRLQGSLEAMRMMYDPIERALGPTVAAAMVGQYYGISGDQIAEYLQHGPRMIGLSAIQGGGDGFKVSTSELQTTVNDLEESQLPKNASFKNIQALIKRTGTPQELANFYNNYGAAWATGNRGNLQDAFHKYEIGTKMREYLPELHKEARSLGMTKSTWDQITGDVGGTTTIVGRGREKTTYKTPWTATPANADQIAQKVQDWAKNQSKNWNNQQMQAGGSSVIVDLSPAAKKWLTVNVPNAKNNVNNGSVAANQSAATQPLPAYNYEQYPGNFEPAGAQAYAGM